jgi:hypothetical protein
MGTCMRSGTTTATKNNLFPYVVAQGDGDVRIAWQDDRNDFDSGGVTHTLWGEGPSYAGPGNVWYARGQ